MMIRTALFSALTILSLSAVVPASARDADAPTRTVGYLDLDLARGQGLSQLQHRINAAAKAICGEPDSRDLAAVQEARTCYKAAMASTQAQVAVAVNGARQVATRSMTGTEIAGR